MMTPSGDGRAALGGFLLLFVASRLLHLLLSDAHSQWSDEELYRGTIAQELVTGLTLPFTEYRADNYSGGSLVIGALAAGFFLLFGPTLFALKLAPLLMFTLALVFWYWTIQRAAGERVAGYFALLFCFSPPPLTAYSVTAMGFHSETIFFSVLTVWLLFRMLSEEKPSLAYPLLLGLTAGVGLWFCYTYGLTLLTLLGFWLWHDKGMLRRWRVLWFALGFLVGFSPWILINAQTHLAGLVVQGKPVWEHFGLDYLLKGLAQPRKLAPYEFFADIASDDPQDLYRRAVNLLYALLFLGPILTAGVLRLKTGRSAPDGARRTRPTLVGFAILYLVVFTLAVQFSDFREARYHLPAYPFLFFLAAHALVYCQDLLPHAQRQIQTVFLASVVGLGLGTHTPLLSLDRPCEALSAKGYAYTLLPGYYWGTHAPGGLGERKVLLEVVQRPFLFAILPKLSPDDQRELSRALARLLAGAVSLNGQPEDFARFERVVPPGFDRHFAYQLGVTAMDRHPHELPKAVAAVEFVRHRSAAAHHLALVGIYRRWPKLAALDSSPETLVASAASVPPELSPHYWRALGFLAGRYWHETDPSWSLLNARVQAFVPRLTPPVQQSVLQGVGQALFPYPDPFSPHWGLAAELERFPPAYQQAILEGWGMALGEEGQESPFGTEWTKGLSARSLSYVQQGKVQFDALFEGAASSALEPPRHAP
jgi:4-amino-4-deoxy-L-arabinose transferase-like glycosyltransferase